MVREQPNLTMRETWLLGFWVFYGAFVATSTVFYGLGFPFSVSLGLAFLWLLWLCRSVRPRGLVLAGATLLGWALTKALPHVVDAVPELDMARTGTFTSWAGALAGVPLLWATGRTWRHRKHVAPRRRALAAFDDRARALIKRLAGRNIRSLRHREFVANLMSGAVTRFLEELCEEKSWLEFDYNVLRFESLLHEVEREAARDRHREDEGESAPPDPYDILMCSPEASFEAVEKAYKAYCKLYHPDFVRGRGGDQEVALRMMQRGNLAYERIKRMRGIS